MRGVHASASTIRARRRSALRRALHGSACGALLLAASAEQGARYDVGVAALADEIEARAANRALAQRVEERSAQLAGDPERAAADIRAGLAQRGLRVLRVPGLFYRSRPQTGADLSSVTRWLGTEAALVATGEAAPVEENAATVAAAVRAATLDGARAVLISASKGGADVRAALESEPGMGPRVALWIDLVGLIEGTPLTDPGVEWSDHVTRWLPPSTARSMSREVRARAAAQARFPRETRAVHVAAFPREAEISEAARPAFERLRALGPNDGYLLLDAFRRAPGRVLVVRGADHYLVAQDVGARVAALLLVLLEELGPDAS